MAGNGTNGVFWNPHALVLVARRIAGLATHLSGAIRTELLLWLTGESASASELARRVGVDDARMSRLLGKLREAGVTAPCGVRRRALWSWDRTCASIGTTDSSRSSSRTRPASR